MEFETQEKISGASGKNHGRFISGFSAPVPRPTVKIEWDPDQPGLGRWFRGKSSHGTWVVQWLRDGRSFRRSIGSTQHMGRDAALSIACQLRDPNADVPPLRVAPCPTVAAFIATFQRDCAGRWKPATPNAIRLRCEKHLVPAFGHWRVDEITRTAVVQWFESKRESASWCLSVLSSLMVLALTPN